MPSPKRTAPKAGATGGVHPIHAGLTIAAAIAAAEQQFDAAQLSFGHGTTNAFDEAAWLVLWRLRLPLDSADDALSAPVDAAQAQAVQDLITERITTRKPAAYLTGEAWLQGVPFFVDERVIVPRSLIAEPLADGGLDAWLPDGLSTVLDLCTGSACLAVLAAMVWPDVVVTATDLSADALVVARRNVDRHGLADRITLRRGDGLAAAPGHFDVILCNPPYVNRQAMAALPAEYQAEPAMALDGGVDGMDFIRRLIAQAPAHLGEDSVLLVEVGHERQHFEDTFRRLQPVWLPTSAGDDHVLLLTGRQLGAHGPSQRGRTER